MSNINYYDKEKRKYEEIPMNGSDSFLVSDAFSSVKNYSKGDYCIHSNTLYKFITSKEPGEWDPSVVEATNVGNEIGLKIIIPQTKVQNEGDTFLVNSESYSFGILFVYGTDLKTLVGSTAFMPDNTTIRVNEESSYDLRLSLTDKKVILAGSSVKYYGVNIIAIGIL